MAIAVKSLIALCAAPIAIRGPTIPSSPSLHFSRLSLLFQFLFFFVLFSSLPSILLLFPSSIYVISSQHLHIHRHTEEKGKSIECEMVGLSVVLESHKGGVSKNSKTTPQVINKTTMMMMMFSNNTNKHSPSSSSSSAVSLNNIPHQQHYSPFIQKSTFLELCFLCRKKLLPGKDIYMYKGDKAFCSEECRCKQIFMDEEEVIHRENCSLAAMRPTSITFSPPPSSSSSSSSRHHQKGARRGAGGFAY